MPDKTVTVGFNPPDKNLPPDNHSWSFSPMEVTITKAGVINFHRDPNSKKKWTFKKVEFHPTEDWTGNANGDGSSYMVNDSLKPPKGTFWYTVTVAYEGVDYISPETWIEHEGPPIIMNDG